MQSDVGPSSPALASPRSPALSAALTFDDEAETGTDSHADMLSFYPKLSNASLLSQIDTTKHEIAQHLAWNLLEEGQVK